MGVAWIVCSHRTCFRWRTLEGTEEDLTLPNVKLHDRFHKLEEEEDKDRSDKFPVYNTSKYINTTDNKVLCKKSVFFKPYVSSRRSSHTEACSNGGESDVIDEEDKTIPVF